MLTNELLEAKYRAQRALANQGGDDLREYAQNVHRIVREVERKQGLKFRYRLADKQTATEPRAVERST
jgi:hypothetical protein